MPDEAPQDRYDNKASALCTRTSRTLQSKWKKSEAWQSRTQWAVKRGRESTARNCEQMIKERSALGRLQGVPSVHHHFGLRIKFAQQRAQTPTREKIPMIAIEHVAWRGEIVMEIRNQS